MEIFVVTMYRYGDHEKHSYVLSAFSTAELAKRWGEIEKISRGNKYEPEIIAIALDEITLPQMDEGG